MKNQILLKISVACLILGLIVSACSSNDAKDKADKNSQSTAEKQVTLPPLETSSTTTVPGTAILANTPFLTSEGISSTWTKTKLCGLVGSKQAQKILSMKTTPQGKYLFSKESGARCTYRSGSGEELFFEISISTYADARSVDIALGEHSKPVTLKGVSGVVKSSQAFGTTYEINVGGEKSNQWIANAPDSSSAKSLTETLIKSLS